MSYDSWKTRSPDDDLYHRQPWIDEEPEEEEPEAEEDFRIGWCEACGSEGFRGYTATVYENGCGYGHDDYFLDYSSPCPHCEGTGRAIIPVEPVTLDELEELAAMEETQ